MKKFASGFILGAFLFGTVNAFAEPLYSIGVRFNIKDIIVNGNSLPLASRPLNYNGVSYAPVRALVESLGYETKWDAQKQTIEIVKPTIKTNITIDMVKQSIQNQGLPLNSPKLSYHTLNSVKPVSYQIGNMEHVHIYIYNSYEDRVKGRLEFEVIKSKTDMNVPFVYEVNNALIFYVPFNKETNLYSKLDLAIKDLQK